MSHAELRKVIDNLHLRLQSPNKKIPFKYCMLLFFLFDGHGIYDKLQENTL